MAYCTNCGTELTPGASFCGECGVRVDSIAAPAKAQEPASKPASGSKPPLPSAQGAAGAVRKAVGVLAGDFAASDVPGEMSLGASGGQGDLLKAARVAVAAPQRAATTAQATAARQQQSPARPSAYAVRPPQAAGSTTRQGASFTRPDQPSVRYSQSQKAAVPRRRKKSKAPLAIGVAAVVAAAALFTIYVVPRFLPNHPGEFVEGAPPQSSQVGQQTSSGASQGASDAQQGSSQPESSSQGAGQDVSQGLEQQGGSTPAVDFVAYDLPTLADFQWVTGQAAAGYVPDGCYAITDFAQMKDSWKAYSYGDGTDRFFNAVIDGSEDSVTVALKWGVVYVGSDGQSHGDESPDSTFSGTWDGGALSATGPGRLDVVAAWTDGTRQYATGSLVWPSGEIANICLVRP